MSTGWAKRELDRLAKEVSTWPDWMKASARRKSGRSPAGKEPSGDVSRAGLGSPDARYAYDNTSELVHDLAQQAHDWRVRADRLERALSIAAEDWTGTYYAEETAAEIKAIWLTEAINNEENG